MNNLLSLANASDKGAVTETNMEAIDRSLAFALTPSLDTTGAPTTALGAPTAGTFTQDALWTDALCAVWRCTAPGTPGTWMQVQPAAVLTANLPSSPPDKYLVFVPDGPWKLQYWNESTTAWVTV